MFSASSVCRLISWFVCKNKNLDGGCVSVHNRPHSHLVRIQIKGRIQKLFGTTQNRVFLFYFSFVPEEIMDRVDLNMFCYVCTALIGQLSQT